MWVYLAFCSATLLGFYDVFKKQSLKNNAVIPILYLNTLFCSLLFLPFLLFSYYAPSSLMGTIFYVSPVCVTAHLFIFLKSIIVLSSWIFGYFAIKHLPLTIVGPINATRPVLVLLGAVFLFGEHLNLYQWIGVTLTIISFFLLSRTGKKEGIDFKHNKWIFFLVAAALLGASSGLYDKFMMRHFDRMAVLTWYSFYQCLLMLVIFLFLWWPKRKKSTPFRWKWSIPLISIFLTTADFFYFYALSDPSSMISIVSMIRRGSVLVSFTVGAFVFREKNLKLKAFDLIVVFLGMLFLYLASQ